MQHQDTVKPHGGDGLSSSGIIAGAPGDMDQSTVGASRPDGFDVSFGRKGPYTTVPADSYRLVNAGRVVIDRQAVVLAGHRTRPFRLPAYETHTFPCAAVMNVGRQGKTITFQVRGPDAPVRTARFDAASEAQAINIVALLPTHQTEAFAANQQELADFHARLDALSPRAPVTPAIVGLNVLVFVAMCFAGAGLMTSDGRVAMAWGSNFGPLTMDGQWWRLLTCTFIHFGVAHIALNMWALYKSGPTLERLLGSGRYALLYLFAGLSGSVASLLWNPEVNSAGASGAIFGVFGGLLAFVINPRNGVPQAVMAEQRNSTLAFAGYSLAYGMIHAGIDNAAHVGGLLGGFGMGLLLARPLHAEARALPGTDRLAGAMLAGTLVLALSAWPLVHPSSQVQAGLQFHRMLTDFPGHEAAALKITQDYSDKLEKGMSKADYNYLQADVLPRWDSLYDEVAAPRVQPGGHDDALQGAMLRYIDGRRRQLRMHGEALASNDRVRLQQAWAAKRQADEAIEEVKKINAGH